MPEAWTVEADHMIALRKKVDKPVSREILDHGSVAIEQHDARSRRITPLDIVETHTRAFEELADWRILPLRQFGEADGTDGEKYEQRSRDEQYGFRSSHD